MDTTEFITLSFMLACTLGPLMGFVLALSGFFLRSMDHAGFSITLGKRPLPTKNQSKTSGEVIDYVSR